MNICTKFDVGEVAFAVLSGGNYMYKATPYEIHSIHIDVIGKETNIYYSMRGITSMLHEKWLFLTRDRAETEIERLNNSDS